MKGHSKYLTKAALLMAAAITLLTGCAVLTVDVDVYNGPLANDETIQAGQVVAMASASKALLTTLQSQLQRNMGELSGLSSAKFNTKYGPASMPEFGTNSSEYFKYSNLCEQVTAILSLYSNRKNVLKTPAELTNVSLAYNKIATARSNFWRTYSDLTNSPASKIDQYIPAYTNALANLSQQIQFPHDIGISPLNIGDAQDERATLNSALAEATLLGQNIMTGGDKKQISSKITSTASDVAEQNLAELKNALVANSLLDGRFDKGLNELIDNYLDNTNHTNLQAARETMVLALVDFAEKVKFITDNSIAANVSSDYSVAHREIIASTAVLESIGNSILTLCDEITRKDRFDTDLTNRFNPEWNALTNAIAFVKSNNTNNFACSNLVNFAMSLTNGGDVKATLDILITELRDIQLTATLSGDNNQAQNAGKALTLAESYRTDLIYIRPSNAFLRSSYPATTLQPGRNIGWNNLLDEQSSRSLPWPLDTWFQNGFPLQQKTYQLEVQQEIDKQFWQRINSVRVAAAGITSYAVVKDDIGNWYVKSFSSDPSPIIDGAKNLMGFASPTASTVKGIATQVTTMATNTTTTLQPTILAKEYGKFATNYYTATLADGAKVSSYMTNLLNQVSAKAGPLGTDASNFLATVTNNYNTYLAKDTVSLTNAVASGVVVDISQQILATFHQIKRFQDSTLADLGTNAAQKTVITNAVSTDFKDLLTTRLNNLNKYQNQLSVLSQFQ